VLNIPIVTQCAGRNASGTFSQSVSWSRNCTSFVGPEQSVPCLQQNTARHVNCHYTFTNKEHRGVLSILLLLVTSSILFSSPSGRHNSKKTSVNWTACMELSPSWEANRYSACQEYHGTGRLITASVSVRQMSLSWASSIHSLHPYRTSWRCTLILFSHLRLGLPSGLLPSRFPTKTLDTTLSSLIRATCPVRLILFDVKPTQYSLSFRDH
jgi:hypothetical protein